MPTTNAANGFSEGLVNKCNKQLHEKRFWLYAMDSNSRQTKKVSARIVISNCWYLIGINLKKRASEESVDENILLPLKKRKEP